jgi:hypothetical protein
LGFNETWQQLCFGFEPTQIRSFTKPGAAKSHLQVPMYEPSLFTSVKDGEGLSCLWFWAIDYSKVRREAPYKHNSHPI